MSHVNVQREVSAEQMSRLDQAVQFYGRSLANYADAEVEGKHKRYSELQQRLYTNPKLSEDALERGNDFSNIREFNPSFDFFVCTGLGDYEKALKEYDEAVKRNPGNPRPYVTRAWCHLKRKPRNCADAIKDCKTALKLDPKCGSLKNALSHRA